MHVLGVPWLQLPCQPNILLQTLFTESYYSIRVTDLSNIWGEDLKRRDVKSRAEELDCPLDVEANLKDLLKHLQDALTVESKSTSILLKRTKTKLEIASTEQVGRAAIEWSFRLELLPYSAVASGLTLSLFSMMTYYQKCVKDLLLLVDEKDTVIRQMNDFCRNANLTFKPNRRQRAFKKFEESAWLDKCREGAEKEAKGSQEVIDDLSLIGRESEFRKDWRAVLAKVPTWEVEFLPDTTERSPTKVLSSVRKVSTGNSGHIFDGLQSPPRMQKEDTMAENAAFISPEAIRIKDKKKIHTKWSSPVPSDQGQSSDRTPRGAASERSRSATQSPIAQRRPNLLSTASLSPPALYKLKDNRESQALEEDVDLYAQSSQVSAAAKLPTTNPATREKQPALNDDTTDESDEDLDNLGPRARQDVPQYVEERQENKQTPLERQTQESPTANRKLSTTSMAPPETPTRSRIDTSVSPRKSQVLNIISPRKSRVQNIISPQSRRTTQDVALEKPPEPPQLQSEDTGQSQIIDLEAERRQRQLQKRKEAEDIINRQSKSSKKRKF